MSFSSERASDRSSVQFKLRAESIISSRDKFDTIVFESRFQIYIKTCINFNLHLADEILFVMSISFCYSPNVYLYSLAILRIACCRKKFSPIFLSIKVPIRDIFFYLCRIFTKCRYEKTKTEMNLLFFSPSYRALNVQLFGNYSAKNCQNREQGKLETTTSYWEPAFLSSRFSVVNTASVSDLYSIF